MKQHPKVKELLGLYVEKFVEYAQNRWERNDEIYKNDVCSYITWNIYERMLEGTRTENIIFCTRRE